MLRKSLSRFEDYSDVELSDVFRHLNHVEYHHQWSLLFLFLLIMAAGVCCFLYGWSRSIVNEVGRITVLLNNSNMVVYILLNAVLHADNLSGSVVKTSHHTCLHMSRMIGLEVEMSVCVHGLPVDKTCPSCQLLFSWVECLCKGVPHFPAWPLCDGKGAVRNVSSTYLFRNLGLHDWCCLQWQLLKEVVHHSREWRVHCCIFLLLVDISPVTEVGGPQAHLQQLCKLFWEVRGPVPQCLVLLKPPTNDRDCLTYRCWWRGRRHQSSLKSYHSPCTMHIFHHLCKIPGDSNMGTNLSW